MMTKAEEKLIDGWIDNTVRRIAPNDYDLYDDMRQEGWVIALEAYQSFDPDAGSSLQSWVLTYLKRDLVRWIENERKHETGHCDIEDWIDVDDVDELIDYEEVDLLSARVDLDKLVAICDERELNVVEKFYFEDMSEQEIADELGVSRSMVQKLRNRALAKMKEAAGVSIT